jgi:hypothetical protein
MSSDPTRSEKLPKLLYQGRKIMSVQFICGSPAEFTEGAIWEGSLRRSCLPRRRGPCFSLVSPALASSGFAEQKSPPFG